MEDRIVVQARRIRFGYTNWQSRHSVKHVETRAVFFGTHEDFYPGAPAQWYLVGIDLGKNAQRSYQMSRMEGVELVI